jgi:zinc/manganese transport system permease protein
MLTYAFMVNAFRAGLVVAVLGAVVGWFMVLRQQSFAGHTLAVVSFPGAAGATLVGIGAAYGLFGFAIAAALVIAAVPGGAGRGYGEESAVTGTVQAFALAAGYLFVSLYGGFLGGANALLFGTFLGITTGQVRTLSVVALAVVGILAVIGRPLLFASVDAEIATARQVPVRLLSTAFLVLLAVTAAEVSQVTGTLLVFALLVAPAATAQQITARPLPGLALSVVLGIATVWASLTIAYYTSYPVGFLLTTLGFGCYATVSVAKRTVPRYARWP